jgi:hypothetical protein
VSSVTACAYMCPDLQRLKQRTPGMQRIPYLERHRQQKKPINIEILLPVSTLQRTLHA